MHERGAERFVEVGPGRVLSGLVKRTLSDVELAGVPAGD
jgi:[acyl-carrier-protein] S-malonyltransferase